MQDAVSPWVFITTTPLNTRPSQDQRLQIYRRVMREIGASRRTRKAKGPRPRRMSPTHRDDDLAGGREPSGPVCGIALNPSLIMAPSTLDGDSRALLQHMFSDALPSHFQIYRDRWYPLCVAHVGAFNQMLATYAMHLSLWQWRQSSASAKALQCLTFSHHLKALAAVRDGIGSPLLNSSPSAPGAQGQDQGLGKGQGLGQCEGILCAVVALACYAHLQGDLRVWKQHMSAVDHIIQQSCFTWAELSSGLRGLIEWVDCIGSYAMDLSPAVDVRDGRTRLEIAAPGQGRGQVQRPQLQKSVPTAVPLMVSVPTRLAGLLGLPLPPDLQVAFDSLESMNSQVALGYAQEGESLWHHPGKIDALVHPVTRRFLVLSTWDCELESAVDASPPSSDSCLLMSPGTPTWTCLRSGALLYLAEFRRRSGISPVNTEVHGRQLCLRLRKCGSLLAPILRLWLLTVAAIEGSEHFEQDDGELARCLAETVREMGIESVAQWEESLREIVWFDALARCKLGSAAKRLQLQFNFASCIA
ncbi:hypothetical protein BDV11DRAFT_170339 [Aspergillus similis]